MGKGRAPCCAKVGLNKGSWTPEEDLRLIAYIQKYGHANWRALPKQAGLLRCGKSCRLRWINYLRPDIKRGNFTKEEEETVIRLHKLLGNKWSKIASCLPGRTDNEIKNVWNTHLKKKAAKMEANEANNINPKDHAIASPASSATTDSVSDNQISKSDTDQSDSSKYATESSTEKHDKSWEPGSDLSSFLPTSSVPSPLMELSIDQNNLWEVDMDAIPMITSPCSSSSEVIQPLEIPEFTIEPEIWDMLEHITGTGKSCNIDQAGLNPETERELNKIDDWLVNLERELGLWETIGEAQPSQMGPLHELDRDPISTYFEIGNGN